MSAHAREGDALAAHRVAEVLADCPPRAAGLSSRTACSFTSCWARARRAPSRAAGASGACERHARVIVPRHAPAVPHRPSGRALTCATASARACVQLRTQRRDGVEGPRRARCSPSRCGCCRRCTRCADLRVHTRQDILVEALKGAVILAVLERLYFTPNSRRARRRKPAARARVQHRWVAPRLTRPLPSRAQLVGGAYRVHQPHVADAAHAGRGLATTRAAGLPAHQAHVGLRSTSLLRGCRAQTTRRARPLSWPRACTCGVNATAAGGAAFVSTREQRGAGGSVGGRVPLACATRCVLATQPPAAGQPVVR